MSVSVCVCVIAKLKLNKYLVRDESKLIIEARTKVCNTLAFASLEHTKQMYIKRNSRKKRIERRIRINIKL